MDEGVQLEAINDRFFANLSDNPSIKRISIYSCNSEEVLLHYPNLLDYISKQDIQLKQGEVDFQRASERGVARARFIEDVVSALSESIQGLSASIL